MAQPYVSVFTAGALTVTTVGCDQADFDAAVDLIGDVTDPQTGQRVDAAARAALKQGGHVPLLGRGIKTEPVFAKFGVKTQHMSLYVRGLGQRLFEAADPETKRAMAAMVEAIVNDPSRN